MSELNRRGIFALLLTLSLPLAAAEKAARILDTSVGLVDKLEVRHSQIGFRNTLIFYTFEDQRAVLRLSIDNKSEKFPITGTVYVFAAGVTAEGLKKWLNNQHSDALFPDVPNPTGSYKLPAGTCKATAHKLIDHSNQPFGRYANYTVNFKVSEATEKGVFNLKAFSGTSRVHIKRP